MQQLTIGLFGFGVVGEGLYKVLHQTTTLNATIKKVCIKHPGKKRSAPASLFTTNAEEILQDKDINVIVELIDDAVAAHYIVTTALNNKKAVVSANKKLIAENLEELLALQQAQQVPFLYEAAACASIPVIRNLEEYYDNDLLQSVSGIVNGSTNFILSKLFNEKISFDQALLQAQQAGFAETDPSLDVEGTDAANKLVLLLLHAYGIITGTQQFLYSGIQHIQLNDAVIAREKNYKIKLVANAIKLSTGKIAAFVLPQFVEDTNRLYHVENEYNGVVIESGFADKQFFYGKGAGSFPTASAVLSDIAALRHNYSYEFKKRTYQQPAVLSDDFYLNVYISASFGVQIRKEDFDWVEESYAGPKHSYLTGIIHYSKLLRSNWWRKPGISLVLLPEPVIETLQARQLSHVSLLAEEATEA
jgi:homoserine dehydrogenase